MPLFSSFEAIAFVLRYQKQGVPLELGPSITDLAVGNVYICTPKSHPTTSPPPHLTSPPHHLTTSPPHTYLHSLVGRRVGHVHDV